MSRCGRCGKDPCRCPSWAQVHKGNFVKRAPRGPSRREVNDRRLFLKNQQETAAPGRRGSGGGGGRRRQAAAPEMTAAEVYQLLDFLEGIGVKTRTDPPPPATCPACGLEALCSHGVCLMCNPCPKCDEENP